jgi:predicted DNA-binding transcriptional regulator AlpA
LGCAKKTKKCDFQREACRWREFDRQQGTKISGRRWREGRKGQSSKHESMPYISIAELADFLRLSRSRTYVLSRNRWFPREIFLGRIVMDAAAVKRVLRLRFYRPPSVPEKPGGEHTQLLTLDEAATRFERGTLTVRRLVFQKKVGVYRIGRLLIPMEEVERVAPLFRVGTASRTPRGKPT